MECVVCYDTIGRARKRGCHNARCRGRSMVCDSCDARLTRCVYCHERLRPSRSEPAADMLKIYVALYYSTLIGYFMGHVDDQWLDSIQNGDSSSSSSSPSSSSESVSELTPESVSELTPGPCLA